MTITMTTLNTIDCLSPVPWNPWNPKSISIGFRKKKRFKINLLESDLTDRRGQLPFGMCFQTRYILFRFKFYRFAPGSHRRPMLPVRLEAQRARRRREALAWVAIGVGFTSLIAFVFILSHEP